MKKALLILFLGLVSGYNMDVVAQLSGGSIIANPKAPCNPPQVESVSVTGSGGSGNYWFELDNSGTAFEGNIDHSFPPVFI